MIHKICFLLCLFVFIETHAQKADVIISKEGMGSMKLGMYYDDLEKLLGKKIVLTKNYLDSLSGSYEDTANIVYKNIPVELIFRRNLHLPNPSFMKLISIKTKCPVCKTASGIGVGTDWTKIITTYNNRRVRIQPGHYNYFETDMTPGKSTITVFNYVTTVDDWADEYALIFYMMHKKVQSFEMNVKYSGY